MAKSTKSKRDLYQEVADKIVAKLDEGVIPWRRPFAGYGENKLPRNYNSNRPYRGINVFLLAFAGYGSPYWLTFEGAKLAAYEQAERAAGRKPAKLDKAELRKLGASVGGVRKGEKSTMIVFWKRLRVDAKPGEQADKNGKKTVMLLRYFNVFNVEQCDGVDPTRGAGEQPQADEGFDPIVEAETTLAGYFDRADAPEFQVRGNVACYDILNDVVTVPEPARFDVREEYYSAAFHEAVHSTGAASRLARKGIVGQRSTESYADEELCAEMGAAMLCAVSGIAPATVANSAAYIDHWRRKISEDPKIVVMAGARAQRAADHILAVEFGEVADDQEQQPKTDAALVAA